MMAVVTVVAMLHTTPDHGVVLPRARNVTEPIPVDHFVPDHSCPAVLLNPMDVLLRPEEAMGLHSVELGDGRAIRRLQMIWLETALMMVVVSGAIWGPGDPSGRGELCLKS